jgi:type III secretion protein T
MTNVVTATDNFLSLFLEFAHLSPQTILSAFFLTLARLIPIMALAPFFGAKTLPVSIRMMFAISLCAILLPQNIFALHAEIPMDSTYVLFLLKELFIGFILGYLVAMPFYIAQSSGSLIDHIRGSASLQVTDPTTSTQTGPVGIFYNYVLIAVFFAVGGPFLFINAISMSFDLIPINQLLNSQFFSMKIPFWPLIVGLLNHILAISIQLGAPSIIGILMAEMFLGIANRMAPQVQIVFLGIPLKSWVGLALLAAAWYFILNQLGKESLVWIQEIENTIRQAAKGT